MMPSKKTTTEFYTDKSIKSAGFTLIELMVALVVGAVVIAIIYSVYIVQQRSFQRASLVVETQQNVRNAFILLERDIRMIGYDRQNSDLFGITDIRQTGGVDVLTFTSDIGLANPDNGFLDPDETFTYTLFDSPTTPAVGNTDLGRTVGAAATDLVAAGIEQLGFVYAFDADADGALDTAPGGQVIWAIDSDGDNDLDRHLDTSGDGDISPGEATQQLVAIGLPDINTDRIRAVKIFILARAKGMDLSYSNNEVYRVGRYTVAGGGDKFRRRLLVTTVRCRNLGL
jgi:type IV pilus assembly protein PilW